MIDSLLYLTTSRLGTMFNIFLCALFQSNPKEVHLTEIKHKVYYLKCTTNLGIYFEWWDNFKLQGWYDVFYARYKIEREKNNIWCHFMGENLLLLMSEK